MRIKDWDEGHWFNAMLVMALLAFLVGGLI